MKHKIGDIVQIKSLDWYNNNKDKGGIVVCKIWFTTYMCEFCGMNAKITGVQGNSYKIDIDKEHYFWTDDMFEKGVKLIKKKNPQKPILISKDYILSDRLTSIEELDELEKNKESVAWYHSDTNLYIIFSAFEVENWSYSILKEQLNNIYKVIRNDKANMIIESLAKENIIYGENIKKAIDITRKILNKNE